MGWVFLKKTQAFLNPPEFHSDHSTAILQVSSSTKRRQRKQKGSDNVYSKMMYRFQTRRLSELADNTAVLSELNDTVLGSIL